MRAPSLSLRPQVLLPDPLAPVRRLRRAVRGRLLLLRLRAARRREALLRDARERFDERAHPPPNGRDEPGQQRWRPLP